MKVKNRVYTWDDRQLGNEWKEIYLIKDELIPMGREKQAQRESLTNRK